MSVTQLPAACEPAPAVVSATVLGPTATRLPSPDTVMPPAAPLPSAVPATDRAGLPASTPSPREIPCPTTPPMIGIKRPAPGTRAEVCQLSPAPQPTPSSAPTSFPPACDSSSALPPVNPATTLDATTPPLAQPHALPPPTAPTSMPHQPPGMLLDAPAAPATVCSAMAIDNNNPDAAQPPNAKRPRPTREGVRRGKWTSEEQAYADRLIRDFEAGALPLENGATLRAFLSKKLNCDPMRISKKFAGARCLGKQIFLKRATEPNAETVQYDDSSLKKLENDFLRSISNSSANTTTRRRNRGGNGTPAGDSAGKGTKRATNPGEDKAKRGSPRVKLSSSDEAETDEDLDSDLPMLKVPTLVMTMTSPKPKLEHGLTSSDEDLCCSSSDESSLDDPLAQHSGGHTESSMLVIEDIKEAMNALSAELVDLPLPPAHNGTCLVPSVSSNQLTQLAGHCHQSVPMMDDDLNFLAGDIIEPLGEFLPDECFMEYVTA